MSAVGDERHRRPDRLHAIYAVDVPPQVERCVEVPLSL